MASIGHVIVGLAAAHGLAKQADAPLSTGQRLALSATLAFAALAPDLDIVAFALGIPYADAFGHRGASHSFVMTAGVAIVLAVGLAAWLRMGFGACLIAAAVAVMSHPVLDALTDGGLGCALYWPWSTERHFFAVRPIPVAPIGIRFASWRGAWCMAAETLMLSPLLLWMLARRRARHRRAFNRR
jgi:inner membrane protein